MRLERLVGFPMGPLLLQRLFAGGGNIRVFTRFKWEVSKIHHEGTKHTKDARRKTKKVVMAGLLTRPPSQLASARRRDATIGQAERHSVA
jgi:hypothetical protein